MPIWLSVKYKIKNFLKNIIFSIKIYFSWYDNWYNFVKAQFLTMVSIKTLLEEKTIIASNIGGTCNSEPLT